MTAKEAIEVFIDYARRIKAKPHSKHFWNARDIIEGNRLNFKQDKIRKTYDFIKESCKDTVSKDIILAELKKHLKD